MAKWIYERWSLKWDPSLATGSTNRSAIARVDIRTMEATKTSDFAEGDVAIALDSMLDDYNAGRPVSFYLRFQEATTTGSGQTSTTASHGSRTKDWLASQRIKNERLEDIILEDGTVPDDGIHTDGVWYIKVKPAFPTMRILRDGQWDEVETGYVLREGVWKPIEEIYKLQGGQWVQA